VSLDGCALFMGWGIGWNPDLKELAGKRLEWSESNAANEYLDRKVYPLLNGGALISIPEPPARPFCCLAPFIAP
jgi:hypothetical protein